MVKTMIKEWLIYLYLCSVTLVFNCFRMCKLQNKILFVVSFGDNSQYIYEELRRRQIDVKVVIFYKGTSDRLFKKYSDITLVNLDSKNPISFILSMYHLATAERVLIDNYFGFLAWIKFRKGVECIQLWHASGAIKSFGLEDRATVERTLSAQKRFQQVYNNFHKVIVGSEIMADTFMRSFNLPEERILRTGIPRTDFYFDNKSHEEINQKYIKENAVLGKKKRILYAPTFRDGELDHFNLMLDIGKLKKSLADEYILLLRFHPAVKCKTNYEAKYPGFVYNYSSPHYDINELLLITDILITDYSSIPYEFSLLGRPMVFFAYDYEDYKAKRGLVDDYVGMLPGTMVKTNEELVMALLNSDVNEEIMLEYAMKWNRYSQGKSSENVVDYLLDNYGKRQLQ